MFKQISMLKLVYLVGQDLRLHQQIQQMTQFMIFNQPSVFWLLADPINQKKNLESWNFERSKSVINNEVHHVLTLNQEII